MNLDTLKNQLPDYAKDIRLNLSTVLSEEGSPDLTKNQITSLALAASYATRNPYLITLMQNQASQILSEVEINAMKTATTLMAMNNIYYRFTHSMQDESYTTMPAKLRMNGMMNHGIDKMMFELASLAVSAINGCGKCMNAHAAQLLEAGASKLAIQSAIRIASVIFAAAIAREISI